MTLRAIHTAEAPHAAFRSSELAADQRNAPHRRHDRRVHQGHACVHQDTLTEARYSKRPHVMDDATVDRIDRVHTEQLEFVDIYAQQIGRWRTERPSADQARELDRMEERNRHLRDAITTVLALSRELRKGTIERVLEKSDIELGLEALRGSRPANPR